jgi:hypothetical protein
MFLFELRAKSIAAEAAPTTRQWRGNGGRNPRPLSPPLWVKTNIAATAAPRRQVGACKPFNCVQNMREGDF